MALLNLVLYPDKPLKDRCAPIEQFGPRLQKLAEDMLETMHAYDGVGLAGPQVGLTQRIFVCQEPDEEPLCFVNPEIYHMEGEVTADEGCLSLPEIYAPVTRAECVRVRAYDAFGKPIDREARGLLARIVQHETDHLDGIVFLDRLDILTREDKAREWADMRERILAAPHGK